jgi:4'-phosphopantetheinyl transferase
MPVDPAIIRPVILAVPAGTERRPRSENRRLSHLARAALMRSARSTGRHLALADLAKDARGAPLPVDGLYWSLTHKPAYVGGVVASEPVGLDIEAVRPVRDALFRKIASEAEWALCGEERQRCFFRYWTAKEAALKATGAGIRELDDCRVTAVAGRRQLTITYRRRRWDLAHLYFDGHVATVVCPPGHRVRWMVRKPLQAENIPVQEVK